MSSLPQGLVSLSNKLRKAHLKEIDSPVDPIEGKLSEDMILCLQSLREKHRLKKDAAINCIAIRTPEFVEDQKRDSRGKELQLIHFYGDKFPIDLLWNRSGFWSSELEWADQVRSSSAEV